MFHIPLDLPGRLWIMPCPDAARLVQAIATYHDAGVERLVSMLAVPEVTALGLGTEAAVCAAAGLSFEQHPTADFGLPDVAAFAALVQRLLDRLQQGETIAVHCRKGIGRAGMVTAGILIEMGQTAPDAMMHVSKARGVSIPDTVEQGRFLADFAIRKRYNASNQDLELKQV